MNDKTAMDVLNEQNEQMILEHRLRESMREHYLRELARPMEYNRRPRARNHKDWHSLPLGPTISLKDRRVWVWSDLHFGHKNIIDYSNRPYPNTEIMDEHLIENFNDYVESDDISIWVGDVTFYKEEQSQEIVNRCNGYKILIVGNHDFGYSTKKLKDMGFDEVHLLMIHETEEASMLFTHYPIEIDRPWINVHGHEHISAAHTPYRRSNQHINVCCELHEFKPIPFDLLCSWARTRTISYEPGKKKGK